MQARIRSLVIIFLIGFLIITLNLTYIQIFQADSLLNNPNNTRFLTEELAIERGIMQTADKVVIAKSRIAENGYRRYYPQEEICAPVTGYYDIRFGRSGLEQSYNSYLLGKAKFSTFQEYLDDIAGRGHKGNDLYLTLNYKLQKAAYRAIEGKKGAVVAINPKTGGVLAIASWPSYNPNNISKNWNTLIKDKGSPLLNRALSGRYPPGSSFKIVSASAALDLGLASLKKYYPAPNELPVYGGKVTNYESKSYGQVNLEKAFTKSINTVFGQVGLDVGAIKLVDYASRFGFNREIPFDLDMRQSQTKQATAMDKLEVAWTAVGQAATLATPFQMALVGATIANSGNLMKPYLVQKIRNYKGLRVMDAKPQILEKVMKKKTAKEVKAMMTKVVDQGTGQAANLGYNKVAGKTGTAEVYGMRPHAWFVGFAPADNPTIAIAVLVENVGTGGANAAPIAKQILSVALSQ
ncbi:MAG: peptidoglycan glycosyltransferase [Actinobacteria bacterium]|nr:MAG: peptidoglycan glycosyltransferase [Actinomycetota bacterium]